MKTPGIYYDPKNALVWVMCGSESVYLLSEFKKLVRKHGDSLPLFKKALYLIQKHKKTHRR